MPRSRLRSRSTTSTPLCGWPAALGALPLGWAGRAAGLARRRARRRDPPARGPRGAQRRPRRARRVHELVGAGDTGTVLRPITRGARRVADRSGDDHCRARVRFFDEPSTAACAATTTRPAPGTATPSGWRATGAESPGGATTASPGSHWARATPIAPPPSCATSWPPARPTSWSSRTPTPHSAVLLRRGRRDHRGRAPRGTRRGRRRPVRAGGHPDHDAGPRGAGPHAVPAPHRHRCRCPARHADPPLRPPATRGHIRQFVAESLELAAGGRRAGRLGRAGRPATWAPATRCASSARNPARRCPRSPRSSTTPDHPHPRPSARRPGVRGDHRGSRGHADPGPLVADVRAYLQSPGWSWSAAPPLTGPSGGAQVCRLLCVRPRSDACRR